VLLQVEFISPLNVMLEMEIIVLFPAIPTTPPVVPDEVMFI